MLSEIDGYFVNISKKQLIDSVFILSKFVP